MQSTHIQAARLALVNCYPEMHKEVYQAVNRLALGHNIIPLYNQTPLQELMKHSPLLIELLPDDPIIEALPKEEIMLFGAGAVISVEQMVEVLRHRLIVLFNGGMKGISHYYIPKVAGYLFYYPPQSDTAEWLGGMNQVSFYCQTLNEEHHWLDIVIDNPVPFNEHLLDQYKHWQCTPSQEQAMTLYAIDKDTAQWAAGNGLTQWNREQQTELAIWCIEQGITDPQLVRQIRTDVHHHQQAPWHSINTKDPAWRNATQQTKARRIEQLKEVIYD